MNSAESQAEEDFKCPDCPRIFNSKESFDKHWLMHVYKDGHECEICKAVYLYKQELKQHVLSHSNDRPFKCKYCEASYKTQRPLDNHLQNHHSDCIAEKGSPGGELLKNSGKSEVEKTFECPHCPRTFHLKGHTDERFYKHLQLHASENRHECEICKTVCFDRQTLKQHMITHSDDRPFKCKYCDASFKTKQHLDTHLQNRHSDSIAEKYSPGIELLKNSAKYEAGKSFQCPHCPRTFHLKGHTDERFDKHLQLHASENRHECEICKTVCFNSNSLNRHMKSHSNERSFNCEYCGASHKSQRAVDEHLHSYHSDITIFCKVCLQICTPSTIDNHDCDPNSLGLVDSALKEALLDEDEGPSSEQMH